MRCDYPPLDINPVFSGLGDIIIIIIIITIIIIIYSPENRMTQFTEQPCGTLVGPCLPWLALGGSHKPNSAKESK